VRTLEGHTDGVVCLNYNKGTLASGSADAVIKIWNIATGDCYALRGHQGWVNSVLLWDGKSSPSEQSVQDTALSTAAQPSRADSKSFLFSASDDGTIKLWDLQQRACIKTFVGHTGHVQSLKLLIVEKDHEEDDAENTPNRTAISNFSAAATPSETGAISCFSPFAGTFGARSFSVNDIGIHSDHDNDGAKRDSSSTIFNLDDDNKEAILVSAGLDNMIKIWDAETGIEKRTLFGSVLSHRLKPFIAYLLMCETPTGILKEYGESILMHFGLHLDRMVSSRTSCCERQLLMPLSYRSYHQDLGP
jgi:F-box/WD-40 domain protein MET30